MPSDLTRIIIRQDTTANMTADNTQLKAGEPMLDTTTGYLYLPIADGTWNAETPFQRGGGGGGGSLSDGTYGDITVSGSGTVMTIPASTVTLAKMANMATASLIYRKTAGSGAPEVNTLATLKTDLGLSGTNSGDQTITLTGDVTGSGSGSFVATIANGAVTYAKMQDVSATDKILGRATAGAGDVEEITCTAFGRSLIDDAAASNGRTTLGVTQACVRTPLAGFNGNGAVVATGTKVVIPILYTGTIVKWRLVGSVSGAAASGSAVCDVWKATYSTSTLPTVANTITAAAKPTISAAGAAESSTLTGWTTAVTAGDMLVVNVDSCSTFTELVLVIEIDTTT